MLDAQFIVAKQVIKEGDIVYLGILLVFVSVILYLYTVSHLIEYNHSVVKIIFVVIWASFLLIAKSVSRYGITHPYTFVSKQYGGINNGLQWGVKETTTYMPAMTNKEFNLLAMGVLLIALVTIYFLPLITRTNVKK